MTLHDFSQKVSIFQSIDNIRLRVMQREKYVFSQRKTRAFIKYYLGSRSCLYLSWQQSLYTTFEVRENDKIYILPLKSIWLFSHRKSRHIGEIQYKYDHICMRFAKTCWRLWKDSKICLIFPHFNLSVLTHLGITGPICVCQELNNCYSLFFIFNI